VNLRLKYLLGKHELISDKTKFKIHRITYFSSSFI